MQKQLLATFVLLFLGLVIPSGVSAQTETGQIAGTVIDASGAVIPDAKVSVKSLATGALRSVTTSSHGTFVVPNLLPGLFEVSVEASGFAKGVKRVQVAVGSRVPLDFPLQVGAQQTVVEVTGEAGVLVNTETQTLSQVISAQQVSELPSLTRNPFDFVRTVGGVSEDDPSGRGAGVSINGLRSASTNVLLDGAANNDEFTASVGQSVPLDAVQEFSVLTNSFTAEHGRATGGVVNVVTKSGSNVLHGTAYAFNRVSDLSSNSFDNNANGTRKPVFTRNQYGFSVGGPVPGFLRGKVFYFASGEANQVRSASSRSAFVPTPELLAASGRDTRDFFGSLGQLRPNVTTLGVFTRNGLIGQGFDPCRNAEPGGPCMSLPTNLPLFRKVSYNRPSDSGGGDPENSAQGVGRVDWLVDDKTQVYFRYAVEDREIFGGTVSDSPYQGFDTGTDVRNNNLLLSMVRTFSPRLILQSKVVYNRLNLLQPLGTGAVAPTLYFLQSPASILGTSTALPGYLPFSPGNGIPFGGPQNFLQTYQDVSFTKGSHQFRFGGSYNYLQDNRTFGAFQEANLTLGQNFGRALDNLLRGQVFQFQGAVDPQGKFPCGAPVTPQCSVTLPVGQPNFSRSNRFHDVGLYAQDTWRATRRLTVNLGVRWEYFGVQHNSDPSLDSNFFPGGGGSVFERIRNGGVSIAPLSPEGGLYAKDWNNFAPRIGAAYDLFGNGKWSLRGGYGVGYERNFGNVTFNVIQNPPNYAVLSLISGIDFPAIPISTNNAGPLAGTTGSRPLPRTSLRNVDSRIRTAYAHLWSAAIEGEPVKNVFVGVEYSGSNGKKLYSLENPNRPGAGNVYLSDPCTKGSTPGDPGDCTSRLRTTQYTNINTRGNNGASLYNGLNTRVEIRNVASSGLNLRTNYTYSHAIDNLSSTFSESSNNLNLGLLDAFNPGLDRGNADFDNRHRFVLSGTWEIPFARFGLDPQRSLAKRIVEGWNIAPIFTARTGNSFSLFDCTNAVQVCPRAFVNGPLSIEGVDNRPAPGQANTFNYINLLASVINSSFVNPITNTSDFGPFPKNMLGRNLLRGPGSWNLDLGIHKTTKINEHLSVQLRGEMYNLFNHSNLYVVGSGNDVSSVSFVSAKRGVRNGVQEQRNVQFALKLVF